MQVSIIVTLCIIKYFNDLLCDQLKRLETRVLQIQEYPRVMDA